METVNYNIRLDPDIKMQAEETFSAFGLDLSDAINVFLRVSVMRHGFPFELRKPLLKAETLQAIAEADSIVEEYKNGTRQPKPYTSVHDFIQEILNEEDGEDEEDGEI